MFITKKSIIQFLEKAGIEVDGIRPFDPKILDSRFFKQWFIEPSLDMGESYMAEWWDCEQLDVFFYKICRYYQNQTFYLVPSILFSRMRNVLLNLQSPLRSKRVAELHYNLGNDLYKKMLGPSLAYTCGYWRNTLELDQAQYDKFDLVCRKIDLKPGERVLELGCGWGSFAKFAAENYGCRVIGVNISSKQVEYARKSCAHLPVEIYLCDYRDDRVYNPHQLLFDKVVSIGLCEHVGVRNYPAFMQIVRKNLKESGLFLLHTIGKNESHMHVDPWIDKYIFPDGVLPSVAYLAKAMERVFVLEDLHNFGADYDKTLMAWHYNFVESWPLFRSQYGDRFYRMWNYYLLSCAGAFRARGLQLWQMTLSPKGVLGGYQSIR